MLIRNLLRTISLPSRSHCDEELKVDSRDLVEKAKKVKKEDDNLTWYDRQWYPDSQNARMLLDEFMGKVSFGFDAVDPEQFLPVTLLTAYMHADKGRNLGSGKYETVG